MVTVSCIVAMAVSAPRPCSARERSDHYARCCDRENVLHHLNLLPILTKLARPRAGLVNSAHIFAGALKEWYPRNLAGHRLLPSNSIISADQAEAEAPFLAKNCPVARDDYNHDRPSPVEGGNWRSLGSPARNHKRCRSSHAGTAFPADRCIHPARRRGEQSLEASIVCASFGYSRCWSSSVSFAVLVASSAMPPAERRIGLVVMAAIGITVPTVP